MCTSPPSTLTGFSSAELGRPRALAQSGLQSFDKRGTRASPRRQVTTCRRYIGSAPFKAEHRRTRRRPSSVVKPRKSEAGGGGTTLQVESICRWAGAGLIYGPRRCCRQRTHTDATRSGKRIRFCAVRLLRSQLRTRQHHSSKLQGAHKVDSSRLLSLIR